jgi:hypothetical protein
MATLTAAKRLSPKKQDGVRKFRTSVSDGELVKKQVGFDIYYGSFHQWILMLGIKHISSVENIITTKVTLLINLLLCVCVCKYQVVGLVKTSC